MSRGTSLVVKQSVKYFLIIVVGLAALFLGRILWNMPESVHYWGLGVTGLVILIALVFDLLSVKDVIPIFKK